MPTLIELVEDLDSQLFQNGTYVPIHTVSFLNTGRFFISNCQISEFLNGRLGLEILVTSGQQTSVWHIAPVL